MFSFSKKDIIKYAKEYKVNKGTLERVLRLVDILKFINECEEIKGKLALKGGTSINLAYYNYLRLSVDIDLDYIGSLDKDIMLKDRTIIEKSILTYVESNNMQYRPDKSRKTHALDSFVFNYNNYFNSSDMLKIEINYMNRVHLFECEYKQITLPMPSDVNILSLNKFDLFASKMNALIYRTTIRDIYDIYNMINLKTIKPEEMEFFKKSLIFYLLLSTEDKLDIKLLFDECIKRMSAFCNKRLPQYLTATLTENDSFEINKAVSLISEFLNELKSRITNDEFLFINEFPYNQNSLFNDKCIDGKIVNHPMIKWKQFNLNNS